MVQKMRQTAFLTYIGVVAEDKPNLLGPGNALLLSGPDHPVMNEDRNLIRIYLKAIRIKDGKSSGKELQVAEGYVDLSDDLILDSTCHMQELKGSNGSITVCYRFVDAALFVRFGVIIRSQFIHGPSSIYGSITVKEDQEFPCSNGDPIPMIRNSLVVMEDRELTITVNLMVCSTVKNGDEDFQLATGVTSIFPSVRYPKPARVTKRHRLERDSAIDGIELVIGILDPYFYCAMDQSEILS